MTFVSYRDHYVEKRVLDERVRMQCLACGETKLMKVVAGATPTQTFHYLLSTLDECHGDVVGAMTGNSGGQEFYGAPNFNTTNSPSLSVDSASFTVDTVPINGTKVFKDIEVNITVGDVSHKL